MAKSEINFTMGLDAVSFTKGMQAAGRLVDAQTKAMEKMVLKLGGVIVTALGAKKFGSMIVGAFESGKALEMLSRESGLAVDQIELMRHALDRSGVSAEGATEIMTDLRDRMREAQNQGTQTNLAFRALGLNVAELAKKSIPEQFQEIALAVNSIKDPVARASVAMSVLGSAGAKAAANFNAGDIERAAKLFGKQAAAMGIASPSLARASEAFKRIQEGGKMFFDIVVAKLAPVFETVAVRLEEVLPLIGEMATRIGEKLKFAVDFLIAAFKGGKMGELFWLSLKTGVMKTMDFLTNGFRGIGNILLEVVKGAFAFLTSSGFWKGVGDMFAGEIKAAIGAIGVVAFSLTKKVVEFYKMGIEWAAQVAAKVSLTDWSAVFDKITDKFASGMLWIAEKFKALISGAKPRSLEEVAMETGGMMAQMAEKFGEKLGESTAGITFENVFSKGIEKSKSLFTEGVDQWKTGAKGVAGAFMDAMPSMEKIGAILKESMSGPGFFGKDTAETSAKLEALIKKIMDAMKPMESGAAKLARPGEEKGKGVGGMFKEAAFDSFRKVGGGIGAAGQSIAQKQLDKLTEIAAGIRLMTGSTGARLTGSTGARFSSPSPTFMSGGK